MKEAKQKKHPVDRGYAWVILLGCFVMYMLLIGSVKTFGLLYTEFLEQFQTGAGDTAWIGSVCLFILLSLGPFANFLSQKFSFRTVTFIAGLLVCLGYLTSAFVKRMEVMYFTFGVIGGIGYGFGFAPCSTIVSFYFDKHRALANGITVSGSGIGAFLLPFLYKYVIDEYGLEGALIIISGIMLNVCVAASLFRQPVFGEVNITTEEDELNTENEELLAINSSKQVKERLLSKPEIADSQFAKGNNVKKKKCMNGLNFELSLFKVPKFSIWVVAFCLLMLGYTANFTMLPAHILALGYDKDKVVLAMSILGISELFSRVFIGWLADLKLFAPKYIFIVSMLISGVAAICVPFFSSFEILTIYSAIVGVFPGSFWSLISILIIESVGIKKLSPGFGLVSLSLGFGAALSQPVVGWIEDATGNWNMSFRVVGVLKLASGCIVACQPLIEKFFHNQIVPKVIEEEIISENEGVCDKREENSNIPKHNASVDVDHDTDNVVLMELSEISMRKLDAKETAPLADLSDL